MMFLYSHFLCVVLGECLHSRPFNSVQFLALVLPICVMARLLWVCTCGVVGKFWLVWCIPVCDMMHPCLWFIAFVYVWPLMHTCHVCCSFMFILFECIWSAHVGTIFKCVSWLIRMFDTNFVYLKSLIYACIEWMCHLFEQIARKQRQIQLQPQEFKAYPIWHDIFESSFECSQLKLVGLFCNVSVKTDLWAFASSSSKSFGKCPFK